MQEQHRMIRSRLKLLIAERNLERLKSNQPQLTLQQIAREAGLAVSTINGLTTTRSSRIDFETLSALCNYFHVQPGDILEFIADTTSNIN